MAASLSKYMVQDLGVIAWWFLLAQIVHARAPVFRPLVIMIAFESLQDDPTDLFQMPVTVIIVRCGIGIGLL